MSGALASSVGVGAQALQLCLDMKASDLITRARAFADAHPDEADFVEKLIDAIQRIQSEFRGAMCEELMGEAREALERQVELVKSHQANLEALDRLRRSQRDLDRALDRLKALTLTRPKGVTLH